MLAALNKSQRHGRKKMKISENWLSQLNQSQKIIFSILIPVGLLFLFIPIALEFGGSSYADGLQPFNLVRTWNVWLIYIVIVGYLEYKLFNQKKTE